MAQVFIHNRNVPSLLRTCFGPEPDGYIGFDQLVEVLNLAAQPGNCEYVFVLKEETCPSSSKKS